MALGKEELLAAIAAAGTAGRTAYDQAQQQIAAQQQEAVRMALASGVAGNAPAGAQEQLAGIVSQPYQTRTAQITQNRATMDDWYNRQTAMQGTFLDQSLALAEAQAAALAAGGGGGSGGGGGGGGGGDDAPFDWYKNAKDAFGTEGNIAPGIAGEARALGLNSVNNPDLPRYMQTRDYAVQEYGVPIGIAEDWFQPSQFAEDSAKALAGSSNPKAYVKGLYQRAGSQKGNQSYWVNERTAQARQQPGGKNVTKKFTKKMKKKYGY